MENQEEYSQIFTLSINQQIKDQQSLQKRY